MEPTRFQRSLVFTGLVVVMLVALGGVWWLCFRSDSIAFLPGHAGASWIIDVKPLVGKAQPAAPMRTNFKCSFFLNTLPEEATISVRAFKSGGVILNGQRIGDLKLDGKGWKLPATASVARMLVLGTNEISVSVINSSGPPALWLHLQAGAFSLGSDETWLSSPMQSHWLNAHDASVPLHMTDWSRSNDAGPGDSVRSAWPEMALFTIAALALMAFIHLSLKRQVHLRSTKIIYALLAVVIIFRTALFTHDVPLLPHQEGFDVKGHEDYVRFIQTKKALPLPNDGWEMHQPPLYYLGAAIVLNGVGVIAGDDNADFILRAVNGMIGLLHCWLVLLCLRRLFPQSLSAQAIGLLVAGFLPVNLYISMSVTNDPLAGLLVTLAIYLFLRLLESEKQELKLACGLGLVLGLAVLTKLTAAIAVPMLLAAMGLRSLQHRPPSFRPWLRGPGVVVLVCVLTCGWNFVRVWRQIGSLPMPNSQTDPTAAWWQDPGFRTGSYYLGFGRSLISPLFSAWHSFADGIYSTLWADGLISGAARLAARPPWNYALQQMSCWLGTGLTLFAICGMIVCLRRFIRTLDTLAGLLPGMIFAFVGGIFLLSLSSPWLASVKAFYAMPALMPFSALIASSGMWFAQKNRVLQTVLWLLMIVWCAAAFGSFWVRSGNFELWRVRAVFQTSDDNSNDTIDYISRALQLNPNDAYSRLILAQTLDDQGRVQEAVQENDQSLRLQPDSPVALKDLALLLSRGDAGARARAVGFATRACELTRSRLPDFVEALGWTQMRAGMTSEAMESFDFARDLAINTGQFGLLEIFAEVLNNEALSLAASPEAAQRNGELAVELARRACEMTGYQKTVCLGTWAAAYAEAGRFDDAIAIAQRACDSAARNGEDELSHRTQVLLELCRAHQPSRADSPIIVSPAATLR